MPSRNDCRVGCRASRDPSAATTLIPQSELLNQIRERENSPRDVSPLALQKLDATYQDTVRKLTTELNAQAHFVDYAPPAFIGFRNGAYLQLNMNTELEQLAGQSQYRVAALAFDTQIAHILRASSKYFEGNPAFDGIDFSATVRQQAESSAMSLEFVVPFKVLRTYEKYDCTGQELINRSIVLINGERVTLDLQQAEGEASPVQR